MHKLMEYICEELEELERKADKEKSLSMAEIQYGDLLAHFKKNLLKADEMWEESEYSMDGGMGGGNYYSREGSYARGGQGGNRGGGRGGSGGGNSREGGGGNYAYARGGGRGRGRNARRDSMGRYSSNYSRGGDTEEMVEELRELMQEAPDEQTRMEFQQFIQKLEQM